MNDTRIIFDDKFYRICAVVLSKKFARLERQFRRNYEELGLPVPIKGFADKKSYREWVKKATKSQYAPGFALGDILRQFNLDPKNEMHLNALAAKLFFNKNPWKSSEYIQEPIKLITRGDNSTKELWVKIEPWTKKQDYMKLWQTIKGLQKTLPNYRSKEKFQITFERDFAVYQLYLEAKKEIATNKSKDRLSIIETMTKLPDYELVEKRFRKDFFDNLRTITTDLNRRLSDIEIL